jgi:hypothetical protein
MDLDRKARGEPVVRGQQAVEHREHVRVLDDARDGRRLGEQRVDALGMEAFEIVPPHQAPLEPGRERRLDLVDLAGREEIRDDGVAVAADGVGGLFRGLHG